MNTSFTHPEFADHERVVFVNDKARDSRPSSPYTTRSEGLPLGVVECGHMKAQTPPLLTFCACHGV